MLRVIAMLLAVGVLSGCGPREAVDPRQQPVPHDFPYYRAHLIEAKAQLTICDAIPPQTRSTVLEGNCTFAARAWRLRD